MRRTVVSRKGVTLSNKPSPKVVEDKKLTGPKPVLTTTFGVRWGCTTAVVCCNAPTIEKCFFDCTQREHPEDPAPCVKESSPCLYPNDSLAVDYQITFNPSGHAKFCYIMNVTLLPLACNLPYTVPNPLPIQLIQRCTNPDHTTTDTVLAIIEVHQAGNNGSTIMVSDKPVDLTSCGCIDDLSVDNNCKLLFSVCDVDGQITGPPTSPLTADTTNCESPDIDFSSNCGTECFCVVDNPYNVNNNPNHAPFVWRLCNSNGTTVINPTTDPSFPRQIYTPAFKECLASPIINTVVLHKSVDENCTDLSGSQVANDHTTINPGCAELKAEIDVNVDCKTRYCLCKTSEVVLQPLELPSIDYVITLSRLDNACKVCVIPKLTVKGCSPAYEKNGTYEIIFYSADNLYEITNPNFVFTIPKNAPIPYTFTGPKLCYDIATLEQILGGTVIAVSVKFTLERDTFFLSNCTTEKNNNFELTVDSDNEPLIFIPTKVELCDTLSTCGCDLIFAKKVIDEHNDPAEVHVVNTLINNGCIDNTTEDEIINAYFDTPYPLHLTAVFNTAPLCPSDDCCIVKNTATLTVNLPQPVDCESPVNDWQNIVASTTDKIFPCDQ